ncbi:MAG: iron-sulfur cluster assembly accessory protein, partial [Balneolaceae bacterium]
MAQHNEDLDSVISELIDVDEPEKGDEPLSGEVLPGIDLDSGSTEGPVIQLTDRAARQVNKIKADEGLDSGLYLRVAVEGGGCSGLN